MGLLGVMLRSFQKFFDAYKPEDIPSRESDLPQQKSDAHCREIAKEINTVIAERLNEMERKFPTLPAHQEEPAMLTTALKKALHSSLSLVKVEDGGYNIK